MKDDKYFVLIDYDVDGFSLDVLDTKDELQEFLKKRQSIENLTVIEGRKLIPEYKFYYSLEKEDLEE